MDQATQRLEQICRYSHKILKKYVVNGMITLQDGPQLHNLIEQRDYRIICILEVYSQNKNEEDFLENLALLTQVIKEQKEQEADEGQLSNYSGQDFNNDEVISQPQEDQIEDDSFTLKMEEAVSKGLLERPVATWSIEEKRNENRRITFSYNAFKKNNDFADLAHSLIRLHKNATK